MTNTTYITYEEHKQLNLVILKTHSLPLMIAYMIAVVAFGTYGVIIKQWLIAGLCFGFAVIYPLISFLFLRKKIKDSYDKVKDIYASIHYEFTFNENDVNLVLVQKDSKNELATPYEKLQAVVETKKYIFIFIDRSRAYIVNIDGFENFSRVEFRSLVQTKVKKYKIIK